MCNAGSGTARWAGRLNMKRPAGVCPPVRGLHYAAGGGGGGFGGLGGGGFGGLGGSMGVTRPDGREADARFRNDISHAQRAIMRSS